MDDTSTTAPTNNSAATTSENENENMPRTNSPVPPTATSTAPPPLPPRQPPLSTTTDPPAPAPTTPTQYTLATLPLYLQDLYRVLPIPTTPTTPLLTLPQIHALPARPQQYAALLLRRHHLTSQLEQDGLRPEILVARARTHEALAYPELAVGDAYVAFTVGEYEEDGGGDLKGVWGVGGGDGEEEGDEEEVLGRRVRSVKRKAARVLCRCLEGLGCDDRVLGRWEGMLRGLGEDEGEGDGGVDEEGMEDVQDEGWCIFAPDEVVSIDDSAHFGLSRREVYPWNRYEGDRMSDAALAEINSRLSIASEGQLEVRKTILPDLYSKNGAIPTLEDQTADMRLDSEEVPATKKENAQLGLFATRDLPPNTRILTERSALTAIRPHGESLCDACAGDISLLPASERQACPGCGIPFCSPECHDVAMKTYHAPNIDDEETEEGYPPATAPFCPGSTGEADIANLGRAESSDTPEWDLYFLLVVRALQMAETLDCHPLEIWECKYLWGSFEAGPSLGMMAAAGSPSGAKVRLKRSLPFSLQHHVELPLQWFELLMLSREDSAPYTRKWIWRYDWWVVQTLYAKFRGVADARMSSWTGEPETAGVFALWCTANHSCEPGVRWEGGGIRTLTVRAERVGQPQDGEGEWRGLKGGEEVWNHYTDVEEKDFKVRRDWLREVLGGDCRCQRCEREEREGREAQTT
ncbi:uncharacterized protein HMPREF1541_02723 [Cyphellophora europaea CBS 101466]|uniref:SET domain-containing protein n=1 Tax=Cyphellophora europaea (strain CBS 101466) TaxID=1220924 RepID=W2S6K8_CYPE1|nr:uncharacterized protein HMPREF1541_02723 [Cyphellophora europaea CBS 101466]ETN43564.1 hypothetical protein HMPREF1541_02723 [Cyphellophora europaea CBS 101466]